LPASKTLVVDPLIPTGASKWFAVDHLLIGESHNVTVLWDADGSHWPGHGAGLSIFVDGVQRHNSPTIQRVEVQL